jgi:hypothetical protein
VEFKEVEIALKAVREIHVRNIEKQLQENQKVTYLAVQVNALEIDFGKTYFKFLYSGYEVHAKLSQSGYSLEAVNSGNLKTKGTRSIPQFFKQLDAAVKKM